MARRVQQVVELLERRILAGDYRVSAIPGEVQLAKEIGTSRMTARKAYQHLIENGLLIRRENGRLQIRRDAEARKTERKQIAFVAPAWTSPSYNKYRYNASVIAGRMNATVRPIDFVHWDDRMLLEAIDHYDGLFMVPSSEQIPEEIIDRILASQKPTAILDRDLSSHGLPSMDLCPVRFFQKIFDYFALKGHRRLDCFNTQPLTHSMQLRIEQWNLWRNSHAIEGTLISRPVEAYHDPMRHAYQVICDMLDKKEFDSQALFCTTTPAARGVMRALFEHGIQVGRDISISGADDEGDAWAHCPALTVIQPPDPQPYLAVCMEWMLRGGGPWNGPLLMEARDVALLPGESVTNPVNP